MFFDFTNGVQSLGDGHNPFGSRPDRDDDRKGHNGASGCNMDVIEDGLGGRHIFPGNNQSDAIQERLGIYRKILKQGQKEKSKGQGG